MVNQEKIKKVFLDELPKLEETSKRIRIDWKNCIGCIVHFYYDGVEGNVEITNYSNEDKEQLLTLKYKNIDGFKIKTPHFMKSKLGFLVNNIVVNENTKWMIQYFQKGYEEAKLYSYSSNKKIFPICPICSKIKNKKISINNIYHKHSIGCSCSDNISYPNKFAFNMFRQLDVNFINEYSPKWIGTKRYDFYFKIFDKEYILEMDGYFHSKDNLMNNITKEESKEVDNYKDEQAKIHDIEVIRIDCDYVSIKNRFEYIKNKILNSKLNELFNLNEISWDVCNSYGISNLIKTACEYKRNNPELTTTQIGNIMGGYNKVTIKNWLMVGRENNWCNYNPKEELLKSISNNGKSNGKPVEIFKDGISLGIFPSCSELERKSLELFGIKLDHSNISLVCNGKRKSHKGYTFKYV